MTTNTPLKVLDLSASAKQDGSISRLLAADLIAALDARYDEIDVRRRDLSAGLPFIDEAWVNANFTPEDERTNVLRRALALSAELVAELQEAYVIVIGAPIYNFSIPAVI